MDSYVGKEEEEDLQHGVRKAVVYEGTRDNSIQRSPSSLTLLLEEEDKEE